MDLEQLADRVSEITGRRRSSMRELLDAVLAGRLRYEAALDAARVFEGKVSR